MSNDNTNDEKTEPTEEATTDDGSLLEKNLTRRTALIGAGLVGSAAASQSASGVNVGVNDPSAGSNPPSDGPAEVLNLDLESDDVIIDVNGSASNSRVIKRPYLTVDVGFPDPGREVQPGDRVSNIDRDDRLVTTRDNNFGVDSDDIFQAPVLDNATNLETYYPYGHAFGRETTSQPTDDLSQTLNPAIGIKVDSVGVGGSKPVSGISLTPPSPGPFGDRDETGVTYSALSGNGFEIVSGTVEFEDHRQVVTLPNVANNGELRVGEANQLGMQSDFGSLGNGPEGIFFGVRDDPDTESDFFVIGDNTIPDVEDQSPDTTHTGTATFVSAEARENLEANGGTTFQQQSASTVTSIIELTTNPSNPALIKGQVTDGGSPQDGVNVEVTDARGTTQTATTDGDGRYQVTVEGGDTDDAPYEVEAVGFGSGGSTPNDPVTVSPDNGETTVVDFTADSFDITPADGRTDRALIRGQVVDAVGDPVSGVDVDVTPDGGSGTTQTVTTGPDGRYRVSVNRNGNNPFEVEAQGGFGNGGLTRNDPVTVNLGGGQTAVVDFTPETFELTEPTNIIRGQLVDQFGTPQDGVDVVVTDLSNGTTQTVTTDGDGRYQVPVFYKNAEFEVAPQGDFISSATVRVSDFGPSRGEIAVVDFKEGVGPEKSEPDTADENLVVRLPVDSDDNPNQADDLEQGDPVGIRENTGSGFTQTEDFTLLLNGDVIAGDSVESQIDPENAFVETDAGDVFLEAVTDAQTKDDLLPLSGIGNDEPIVEQLSLTPVDDSATTDEVLLDNREEILDNLQVRTNDALRDDVEVVVNDVDQVGSINDNNGEIDGIVIRSTTSVESPYDQSVDVSSVEISSIPVGSDGDPSLFGSDTGDPGTAHPTTTDIATDLGLEPGPFNEVNADTVLNGDIYKIQADPIDAVDKNDDEFEQLGDFEVTDNGISLREDATERVVSNRTESNDLVFRDSVQSNSRNAQSDGDDASRSGPTQYHDGFDILELREPVEEIEGSQTPGNLPPRGLGPSDTNVNSFYGDRFEGVSVRNEGNLEAENIDQLIFSLVNPLDGFSYSETVDGSELGSDTKYRFDKGDIANATPDDLIYFGDNSTENSDLDVDDRATLRLEIDIEDANNVSGNFGSTALFEVPGRDDRASDGEFDSSIPGGDDGLFFQSFADTGNIQGSAAGSDVLVADLYDPSNKAVPVKYIYGDSEGNVEVDGLLDAIRDFRDSKIDVNRLLEVVGEFR